jgi:hypothetical protein
MNEDVLNLSVRKFLKQVGITAQREIEAAIRTALAQGAIGYRDTLHAKATITLAKTSLNLVVDGDIKFN